MKKLNRAILNNKLNFEVDIIMATIIAFTCAGILWYIEMSQGLHTSKLAVFVMFYGIVYLILNAVDIAKRLKRAKYLYEWKLRLIEEKRNAN